MGRSNRKANIYIEQHWPEALAASIRPCQEVIRQTIRNVASRSRVSPQPAEWGELIIVDLMERLIRYMLTGSRKVWSAKVWAPIGLLESVAEHGLPYFSQKAVRIHKLLVNSHRLPTTSTGLVLPFYSALKYNFGVQYADGMVAMARVHFAVTQPTGPQHTSNLITVAKGTEFLTPIIRQVVLMQIRSWACSRLEGSIIRESSALARGELGEMERQERQLRLVERRAKLIEYESMPWQDADWSWK